jgi:hypothetical protein
MSQVFVMNFVYIKRFLCRMNVLTPCLFVGDTDIKSEFMTMNRYNKFIFTGKYR